MSRSKHLRQQEVWRDLIRQHGADYWREAVKRAERAGAQSGWCFLLIFVLSKGITFGAPDLAQILYSGLIVNFGAIIYIAKMQEPILPFVPATRWPHYALALIVGVLYCFILFSTHYASTTNPIAKLNLISALDSVIHGVVAFFAWLFMISANGTAKRNLTHTLQSLSSYPEVHGATPPPVITSAPETCAGSLPEGYIAWTQELDRYLESMRLPTRHTNFQKEALAYGFAHGLAPADFVKFGYNKALSPEEMATLFGKTGSQEAEVAPREEETKTEVAEPPTPAAEADENAQQEVAPKPSTTDRLTALFELYQSGAITSEEFKALRADLDRK